MTAAPREPRTDARTCRHCQARRGGLWEHL